MTSDLRDSLILLLATATLTGLLAPVVVGTVQARNQRRLMVFEADVARQARIIDDQVALLERFADALWGYQLLLVAPLYYGQSAMISVQHPSADDDPYPSARTKYLEDAGMRLGVIRAEIGKAIRLVPEATWTAMSDLFYRHLLVLDMEVTRLLLEGPSETNGSQWSNLHKRVLHELTAEIDRSVARLSSDLSLTAHHDVGKGR